MNHKPLLVHGTVIPQTERKNSNFVSMKNFNEILISALFFYLLSSCAVKAIQAMQAIHSYMTLKQANS